MDAQWEFLASLEDLLKRQTKLYKSFALLLQNIDKNAQPQEHEALVDFLASFEDLLRLESNLIMSFENLMIKKYEEKGPNCWEEYRSTQALDDKEDYNWG
jgi:F0F1-type ATP synthase alpha subunit